jgi:hypothetical protein
LRQHLNEPFGLRKRYRKQRESEPDTGGGEMIGYRIDPDNATGARGCRKILQYVSLTRPNIAERNKIGGMTDDVVILQIVQ